MATVTGLTAETMQDLLNAALTGANVDSNGNLVLHTKGSGDIQAGNVIGPVTTGLVTMFAGGSAPAGWLLCDGSAVSRTAYAKLFAIIGTAYGAGDGTTTFNLPNLKGRIPVGCDSAQTEFDTVGETGGEKTHLLSSNEMPSHTHVQNSHGHTLTDPTHNHTQNGHGHGVTDPTHTHTQNSHNHTQSSHDHTGIGHTHSFSATTSLSGTHSHGPTTLYGFLTYNNTGTVTRSRFAPYTSGTGGYTFQTPTQADIDYSATTDTAPAHTHTVSGTTGSTTPDVNSTTAVNLSTTATNIASSTGVTVNSTTPTNNASGTGITLASTTATNQNTGGGAAHNNLQPYVVMNYIIKF